MFHVEAYAPLSETGIMYVCVQLCILRWDSVSQCLSQKKHAFHDAHLVAISTYVSVVILVTPTAFKYARGVIVDNGLLQNSGPTIISISYNQIQRCILATGLTKYLYRNLSDILAIEILVCIYFLFCC